MGTLPTHLNGSWIRAAEYMVTIPGHLTENTIVMQLLHKVVGVNSRIPRVHAVAGGSHVQCHTCMHTLYMYIIIYIVHGKYSMCISPVNVVWD